MAEHSELVQTDQSAELEMEVTYQENASRLNGHMEEAAEQKEDESLVDLTEKSTKDGSAMEFMAVQGEEESPIAQTAELVEELASQDTTTELKYQMEQTAEQEKEVETLIAHTDYSTQGSITQCKEESKIPIAELEEGVVSQESTTELNGHREQNIGHAYEVESLVSITKDSTNGSAAWENLDDKELDVTRSETAELEVEVIFPEAKDGLNVLIEQAKLPEKEDESQVDNKEDLTRLIPTLERSDNDQDPDVLITSTEIMDTEVSSPEAETEVNSQTEQSTAHEKEVASQVAITEEDAIPVEQTVGHEEIVELEENVDSQEVSVKDTPRDLPAVQELNASMLETKEMEIKDDLLEAADTFPESTETAQGQEDRCSSEVQSADNEDEAIMEALVPSNLPETPEAEGVVGTLLMQTREMEVRTEIPAPRGTVVVPELIGVLPVQTAELEGEIAGNGDIIDFLITENIPGQEGLSTSEVQAADHTEVVMEDLIHSGNSLETPEAKDEVGALLVQTRDAEICAEIPAPEGTAVEVEEFSGVLPVKTVEPEGEVACRGTIIDSLREKIAFQKTTMMELKETIACKEKTILELQKEIESQEITIGALREQTASKETTVEALKEKLWGQESAINELTENVAGKESTILALNEKVSCKETNMEALKEKFTEQEIVIAALKERLANRESAIEELMDKFSTQETAMVALNENVACRDSSMEALEKKFAKQESIITALEEKVACQEAIIASLKEKASGQESTIEALIKELTSCKASEEQARKVAEELEYQFSDLKGKHQSTSIRLRDVSLQYYKELKIKEVIIASSKRSEAQILKLQGQLDTVIDEKTALEATCVDLDRNLIEANDMCALLEDKLRRMDLKFKQTDMLLSQALSEKVELQQKLKTTEELVASGVVGVTSREIDLKFEELGRLSTTSDGKVRAQLVMAKLKLVSLQQKNGDLQLQLTLSERKCNEKLLEIEELEKKTAELTSTLETMEKEKEFSKSQLQMSEDEKRRLDSSLNMTINRISELEQELKELEERFAEQVRHASESQEMKELVMLSDSKRTEAENRAAELELQLESMRGKVHELEEEWRAGYAQYMEAQEELMNYRGTEEKLTIELESFNARSASLEHALEEECKKESELENILAEKESRLEEKENELQCLKKELEDSKVRENEILESLRSLESLSKISGEKLDEVIAVVSTKETEIKELHKKLEFIEQDASKSMALLKAELEASSAANVSLEDVVNELKKKALEMESRVEETLEEEEELEKMNSKLKHEIESDHVKVNELEQKLNSIIAEKEAIAEQLASESLTVVVLKDQNSKVQSHAQEIEVKLEDATVKLQASESEAQVVNEKLRETISVLSRKSSEVEELQKKVIDLEANQEEVAEAAAKVALLTLEMEEVSILRTSLEQQINELNIKVQEADGKTQHLLEQNETMAEANSKLAKEIEAQKTKFSNLQQLLSSIKEENGAPAIVERIASYEAEFHVKEIEAKMQDAVETLEKRESTLKGLNEKLRQALEKTSQKDREVKDLKEKLKSAEEQVAYHQGREAEAAAGVASAKAELMASVIRRTSLEKIITELRNKAQIAEGKIDQLISEKEAVDEMNSKLQSELEEHRTKIDELQLTLSSIKEGKMAIDEKQLSPELIDIASANQQKTREIQTRNLEEEDVGAAEIEKLKALIAELKEQLEEYKVESSLANQIESTIVEDEVTLAMNAKILELEEELQRVEENYETAMKKSGSDDGEEEEDASLSDWELGEKAILLDQLVQLQNELHLAQITLAEQHDLLEEEANKKITLFNEELENMKQKLSQANALEKKAANLQHELQLLNGKGPNKEVRVADTENRDKVDAKSRGLAPVATFPSKMKGKKRGPAAAHTPPSPANTTAQVATTTAATTAITKRRSLCKTAFKLIVVTIIVMLLCMIASNVYDQHHGIDSIKWHY